MHAGDDADGRFNFRAMVMASSTTLSMGTVNARSEACLIPACSSAASDRISRMMTVPEPAQRFTMDSFFR